MREHEEYSLRLLKKHANSDEEVLRLPDDIFVDKEIAARKNLNRKYVALAVFTLSVFFLMIKVVYKPVEPIIIMDEPATIVQLATTPANSEGAEAQSPASLPDNTSDHVLLPNESIETLPSEASLPAEALVAKDEINTEIAAADKTSQDLMQIELAKKKARQKAKKKVEEAMQQSSTEIKSQAETQPQQSIMVPQKALAAEAAEAKKETNNDTIKEAVKEPTQEKSGWSKFADSLKRGGETPCTAAQIAMNQCSQYR